MPSENDGVMIVLSSPSGAGKTTLVKMLSKMDSFEVSISHTTRQPRLNEVNDKDYYFVNEDEFKRLINNQEFLEYAKVFSNFYGTTRTPVIDRLSKGKNVLFDIDWQGAQQLTQAAANDLVKIFILPPNMRELENRLRSRAQDSDDVIARRMSKSENEISHWAEYDYIIINEDISEAIEELTTIVNAERMKRPRQPWLGSFIKKLITGG